MSETLQLLAGALVMIGLLGLAGQFAPSALQLFARRPASRARTSAKTAARVRVLETQELDGGRRLTLVRWDDREHLILTGGEEDLVVETREVRRALHPVAHPTRTA